MSLDLSVADDPSQRSYNRCRLNPAKIVGVNPLDLVTRYWPDTDIEVDHQFSQALAVDEHHTRVDHGCIIASLGGEVGGGDEIAEQHVLARDMEQKSRLQRMGWGSRANRIRSPTTHAGGFQAVRRSLSSRTILRRVSRDRWGRPPLIRTL